MKEAIKNLSGARLGVFLFVWDRTINFREFDAEIVFDDFDESIAGGSRTIRDSIRWLDENGWLSVQKNGNKPQIYGVDFGMLNSAGCLAEVEPEIQFDGGKSGVAKSAKQTEVPSILRSKEKEEPKPSPPVVSTGIDPEESDQVSGSAFEIQKLEELEIVRQMVSYGVNKEIIAKAFMEKGEEWVTKIYREFNADVQKAHNMRSPAAVLASRLKTHDESWRVNEAERVNQVSQKRIDYWQCIIDRNYLDNPESLFWIVRDIAVEQQMGLKDILPLFNTYDVEV
jgi:hypothetical protein